MISRRLRLALLLGILAVAFFARFFALANIPPGLYPDEAINGNDGLAAIRSAKPAVFFPENNGREGLFINLVGLSVSAFGHKPWAIRLVSALFGFFTVPGLYLLARRLLKNEYAALLAAFFLAVSFWHVNFSRIGFRAIMAPFFLVWGLYFLYRIYGKDALSGAAGLCAAVAGGLLFGLGAHSYIAYRAAPALLIVPFLSGISYWRKNNKASGGCFPCTFVLFVFFALVAAAPLLLYFAGHPADFFGRTSQISVFAAQFPFAALRDNAAKTAGMFWFRGDGNWRHNIAGAAQLVWPVGILFASGLLLVLWRMIRNRAFFSGTPALLFWWLVLFLLPVVSSNEGIPHALRAIIVLPAVSTLAAIGLQRLIGWSKPFVERLRLNTAALILLMLTLGGIGAWDVGRYFLRWGMRPEVAGAFASRYTQIAQQLNNLPQESEKYVIVNAGGVPVSGIPMPAQTVMFITDTASTKKQREKHVTYLLPEQLRDAGALELKPGAVFLMEQDVVLERKAQTLLNVSGM